MRRFCFFVGLALVSCRSSERPSDLIFRFAGYGSFQQVEPRVSSSFAVFAHDLVYSPLVSPGKDGAWRARLAVQWERLEGGKMRFRLDEKARFSDGSPVAPAEVIAALAAAQLRASFQGEWLHVQSDPGSGPLEALLPEAVIWKRGPQGFLGTGPFVVLEQSETRIALGRRAPQPRRINNVEFRSYGSTREAFAALLRGEASAYLPLDAGQMELLQNVPKLKVHRGPVLHSVSLVFNTKRLKAAERRQIAAALPIAEIVAAAYGDECQPATALPTSPIQSSGHAVDLLVSDIDPAFEKLALATRRALGRHGGNIRRVQRNEQNRALQRGEFDLAFAVLQSWPPILALSNWRSDSSLNLTGYRNAPFDAALTAGDLARAQQLFVEDLPAVELCRRTRTAAIDSRIRGVELGPWGFFETLPDWEVAQ